MSIIDILTTDQNKSAIWVTTSGEHDDPHVVPLWFILDKMTMYATCSRSSKIGRNLLHNSQLTATVAYQDNKVPSSNIKIVITAIGTIGDDEKGRRNRAISEKYLPPEEAKKRGDKGEENPELLIAIPINPDTVEAFTFPKRKKI